MISPARDTAVPDDPRGLGDPTGTPVADDEPVADDAQVVADPPGGPDTFGMADPFGTAAIRAATLSAWIASPDRFREDANTEEDHARGYYRDRVVTELLQNAADAAGATGGYALLRLDPGARTLVVKNTGAPLTVRGVRALASMRASTKSGTAGDHGDVGVDVAGATDMERRRDDTSAGGSVGRFGVGFSAVRSVADTVDVMSLAAPGTAHGVRFSVSLTARAVQQASAAERSGTALADAVAARDGSLPALRLPFPLGSGTSAQLAPAVPEPETSATPPGPADAAAPADPTWVTAVLLHLRDDDAVAAVRDQLDQLDELTLLALPALRAVRVEVVDETREIEHPRDWDIVTTTGEHDPADLAGRPVEERARAAWSVTWALAPGGTSGVGRVHAPTRTDEQCTLGAVLVATLPLDPTRRHVAPGAVTDAVLRAAGRAYARLAERVAERGGDALALVPTALPAGAVDAALHEAALAALEHAALLPAASAGVPGHRLAPADAVMLADGDPTDDHPADDPALVAALARNVAGLVHVPRDRRAAARRAGVRTRAVTDVVDEVPFADTALLRALRPHVGARRAETFAGLRIALLDGSVAPGPRDVMLLPDAATPPVPGLTEAFTLLGARIADPSHAAADVHDVLEGLGSVIASPRALLDGAAARAAVAALDAALDDAVVPDDLTADEEELAEALMTVVAAAVGHDPDVRFAHLGGLPLENEDGELMAARDLTLPGSAAERLLDALVPVAPDVVAQHGELALAAIGVRTDLVVRTVRDVIATSDPDLADDAGPDGWEHYLAHLAVVVGEGEPVGDVAVVDDLDAVGEDRWAELLERVAGDRVARAALLEPVAGDLAARDGLLRRVEAVSYTAWWLRDHLGAPWQRDGNRRSSILPGLPPALAGADLDDAVWTALGAVADSDLASLDAHAWAQVLDGLPTVGTLVRADEATALWRALPAIAALDESEPPELVVAVGPEPAPRGSGRNAGGGPSRSGAPAPATTEGPASGTGRYAGVLRARVERVEDVIVSDDPAWAQVRPVVPGGADVADLLGVALVDELPQPDVQTFEEQPQHPPTLPTWTRCSRIVVDGHDVSWWPGEPALALDEAGAARAIAHGRGTWQDRHQLEALLRAPDTDTVQLETGW